VCSDLGIFFMHLMFVHEYLMDKIIRKEKKLPCRNTVCMHVCI